MDDGSVVGREGFDVSGKWSHDEEERKKNTNRKLMFLKVLVLCTAKQGDTKCALVRLENGSVYDFDLTYLFAIGVEAWT